VKAAGVRAYLIIKSRLAEGGPEGGIVTVRPVIVGVKASADESDVQKKALP